MPCIKCSNGKWRYGQHGKCVFDTLKKCQDAEAAIHANKKTMDNCDNCARKNTKDCCKNK